MSNVTFNENVSYNEIRDSGQFQSIWKASGQFSKEYRLVDFLHPTIQRIFSDTIYGFVGLGIIATISIALTLRIRQRFHGNDDPAEVDHQMLLQIRDLRREGDLTEEEFRSIKGQLIERIDDSFTQTDRS